MTELDILIQINDKLGTIIQHLDNFSHGMRFIMGILAVFLLWKVISILYRLFGGVFLGGI